MASSFSPMNQTLWFVTIQWLHTVTCLKSFIIHPRSRQYLSPYQRFSGVTWFEMLFVHTEAYIAIILQCFRALIRLNVFLVPLTSVYLPLITILFHCCDIMLTASSSIPVSNKPSSFVCLFVCFCFSPPAPRHLVLVFSTRKWFLEPLCPSQFKHSQYSQSMFSDVTCFKCFLRSLHIKYLQSFINIQCFSCVTCFKYFSKPFELKHTQQLMAIQCFSDVTCFQCLFFYSMLNTSNSSSFGTWAHELWSMSLVTLQHVGSSQTSITGKLTINQWITRVVLNKPRLFRLEVWYNTRERTTS